MTTIISEKEFILKAIRNLRKPPYKGIHAVYSGFNQAFREYFGTDPVEAVNKLEEEELIVVKTAKGGVMIYFVDETPTENTVAETIQKILR